MWRQPCNDDMVIITCAGKWKISREYGGICGQGEGRMKRIVDKGLLLAGGLLMAGQSGRLAAPVIALLLAMTAAAYGSCVDNRRWHCVCLAGMFAVCFILPELCFFVPVLLYDCAEKKEMRLWFLSVPGLAFFYREQIIRQPFLWAADGMLIVAAILLACRTGRILYLEQEMIRLRDTSTELNLVLQEKNKNLMEKQDYEQAQKVLDTISKKRVLDREQLQANLYIAQGELEKAAKLTEEKFLSATTEIHGALMTLMEIALKEKRMEDAEYIADIDKQAAQVVDLWEYNSYGAQFQLYVATKKRAKAVKILLPMLRSLTKKWDINSSPLYRHIQTKEVDKSFGSQLQKALVQSIETDEEMKFLKDSEELQSFIKEAELK